ncbi:MAG: carboxypeptidase-like regulatory domain-containing protein, partial [Bacteroidetes bacterium]
MMIPTWKYMRLSAFLLWCYFLPTALAAQVITGRMINEYNEPLPYANVYVQQLQTGTVSDDEGYYLLNLDVEGEYNLVFSSLGYESKAERVLLVGDTAWVNVQLHTAALELEEIVVNASEKDPAFAIIKKVIEHKERQLRAADSYRTKVYLKAVEESQSLEPQSTASEVEVDVATPGVDPFAAEEAAQKELLNGLNLVEMELWLNFQQPRRYKEERTAFQAYGSTEGLFIPVFAQTDFNFYRNLVYLPGISDAPVISPLSSTAILSYKYELVGSQYENGRHINEIRVIPRKEGNSTVRGTLWIVEDEWTIQRLELSLPVGTLLFADQFRIEQSYVQQGDSLWTVDRLAFHYQTKQGKKRLFKGSTVLRYSEYHHNYAFPDHFFGNEVAVTTQEAYQRDGAYWADTRTEALAAREAALIRMRDSIQELHNSPAFRDSVEQLYNRVNLLEVAWDGVGLRNWREKTHLYIGSLASMLDFSPVGGWRIGPYVSHFKRFDSGHMLSNAATLNYGVQNGDIQGNFSSWFRYDPFRLGDVSLSGGRSFEPIFAFDAYLNLLRPSNYILRDAIRADHRIELFNGFFINSTISLDDRRPITGYRVGSFLQEVVGDEDEIIDFEPYQALITTNTLSYTPGQRYMREPQRKVILGSKWPTFSLQHRRGWQGPLGSDIRFDYLEAAIEQEVILG